MSKIIHVTGPESEQDKYGDEYPVWHAVEIDEETEEEFESWKFYSYEAAEDFFEKCNNVEFEAMGA